MVQRGQQGIQEALRPFILTDVRTTTNELGRGSYATVLELEYRGLKCAGKKLYAILHTQGIGHAARRYLEECRLLSQTRHPNVVQFLGVYFEEGSEFPILVMELLPINLTNCLDRYGVLPDEINYSILNGVALGLSYLHGQIPPIIHRDLSANNVLLSYDMKAKISDLGVARILNLTPLQVSRMTQNPGTPAYMPPEVMIADPHYDTSVDEFSYGVMMIHVFTAEWPLPTVGPTRIDPSNPDGLIPVSEAERREVYIRKIGQDYPLIDLIMRCLNNNPQRRARAVEIAQRLADLVLQFPPSFENTVEMLRRINADVVEKREQQDEIEKKTSTIEQKQNEIEQLGDGSRDLQQQIKSKDFIINEKQGEIERLCEDSRQQMEENDKMKERIELAHSVHKEQLQQEVENLRIQNKCMLEGISSKVYQIGEREQQIIQLHSENEVQRAANSSKENEIVAKTTEISTIRAELSFKEASLSNTRAELSTTREELETKEAELSTTQADLVSAKAKLVTTKAELTTAQADIASTKTELSTTKNNLTTKEAELSLNKTDLASKETELSATKAELSTTRAELSLTRADISSKEAELASKESALKKKEAVNQCLNDQLTRTRDYLTSKPQVKLSYSQCAQTPVKMFFGQSTVINGKVYYGGGETTDCGDDEDEYNLHCYDLSQNTWTTLPPLPVIYFGIGEVKGELVTVGGLTKTTKQSVSDECSGLSGDDSNTSEDTVIEYAATNDVYVFDESAQKWKQSIPPMPTGRSLSAVLSHPSCLVVAGGLLDIMLREYINIVEIYNINTSQWSTTVSLPQACAQLSGAVHNNMVYLMGRWNGKNILNTVYTASIDKLISNTVPVDQTNDDSNSTDNVPEDNLIWKMVTKTPDYYPSAVVVSNMVLAIGGGEISVFSTKPTKAVYAYSQSMDSWLHIGDLPTPVVDAAISPLSPTEFIVIGGQDENAERLSTVHRITLEITIP